MKNEAMVALLEGGELSGMEVKDVCPKKVLFDTPFARNFVHSFDTFRSMGFRDGLKYLMLLYIWLCWKSIYTAATLIAPALRCRIKSSRRASRHISVESRLLPRCPPLLPTSPSPILPS